MPSPSIKHLRKYFPILAWPKPTAHVLGQDALAGITVGLMLVPQAVAYASLAGMPLATGLYASIIPAFIAVILASSARLGVGPSAMSSLMVSSALLPMAIPGTTDWVTLAIWLALLAGLAQLLIGLLRMDWILNVVTSPVLSGFTQAAALLIMASQVPAITGVSWDQWRNASGFDAFMHLWIGMDTEALRYGIAGMIAFVYARKLGPRIPSAMVIVGVAALISWWTDYGARGGAIIGNLDVKLQYFQVPQWIGWDLFGQLLVPALMLALVGFVEVAASAKKDHAQAGTRWVAYQDWTAQGAAKIASGFSGSFVTSASFSRSAVNLYAGALTGWSTIFSALFVWAVALWLAPALQHIPLALLGALIITSVSSMIKPSQFALLWRFSRPETLIALLTFAVTLLAAPRIYWGVLAGLLANLAYFMYQRLHPRIIEVGVFPEDGRLRDRKLWKLPALSGKVLALRMDAALDFASATMLENRVVEALEENPQLQHFCLVASTITGMDATGMETLQRLRHQVNLRKGILFISGMKLPMELKLRDANFFDNPAQVQLLRTDAETIEALRKI